jgi:hypothetical protein
MREQINGPLTKAWIGQIVDHFRDMCKVIPFWALLSSPLNLSFNLYTLLCAKQWNFIKYGYKMLELGIKSNAWGSRVIIVAAHIATRVIGWRQLGRRRRRRRRKRGMKLGFDQIFCSSQFQFSFKPSVLFFTVFKKSHPLYDQTMGTGTMFALLSRYLYWLYILVGKTPSHVYHNFGFFFKQKRAPKMDQIWSLEFYMF